MENKKKALMLASVASMIDQFNMPNIELLQLLGFQVDVIADFTNPGNISRARADNLFTHLKNMGIHVFDIGIPRRPNPIVMREAFKKVQKIVYSSHYDLIHCQSPFGGVIARLAAKKERRRGSKIIYTAHGFHFYNGAPLKNWLIYYPVEKWLSKYTDVLITINREDYNRASKKFRVSQIEYIPGVGIDVAHFHPFSRSQTIRKELGLDKNDIVILSVGELNENKNHKVVIKALADIKKRAKLPENIYYVIVGKGDLEDELKEYAGILGIGERVKLVGYRDDVIKFYEAADYYVFPSFREGLSVSLMEAMANALPIACSKIRGNLDLVDENNGLLFDPHDAKGVAAAIEKLLVADGMRLGTNSLDKIKNFDNSIVKKEMYRIYSSCL